MADLPVVAVIHRTHHILEEFSGDLLGEVADGADFVEEFASLAQVHYDIDVRLVLKPLVHPYDLRMIHQSQQLYFRQKVLQVVQLVLRNYLYRTFILC